MPDRRVSHSSEISHASRTWWSRQPVRLRLLLAFLPALLLAGCKVELYSALSERQGNQVLAVLLNHGIDASKVQGKGDEVSIQVDNADVAAAVNLLDSYGLPRDEFTNLGTVFKQQGLVSSSLEERVRYSYGLSQAVADTLTQIDGVLNARVHVVLPEAATTGQVAEPASAAVFIRYRAGTKIEDDVPQIKQLVQNSVEGLSYEKISVALFAAEDLPVRQAADPPITDLLGIRVARDSLVPLVVALGVLVAVLLAMAVALLLLIRQRRADSANTSGDTATADTATASNAGV